MANDKGNASSNDVELMEVIASADPMSYGVVKGNDLSKIQTKGEPKAVLFVPQGAEISNDLAVEVVGMNAATMAAMVLVAASVDGSL